jgi:hypothetical protein
MDLGNVDTPKMKNRPPSIEEGRLHTPERKVVARRGRIVEAVGGGESEPRPGTKSANVIPTPCPL